MLESLFDFISLSALYTMYAGLFLVLLNLVWIWNMEYQFISSQQLDKERGTLPPGNILNNTQPTYNYIVIWVMEYIRKKTGTPDEDIRFAITTPIAN